MNEKPALASDEASGLFINGTGASQSSQQGTSLLPEPKSPSRDGWALARIPSGVAISSPPARSSSGSGFGAARALSPRRPPTSAPTSAQAELMVDLANLSEKLYATTQAPLLDDAPDLQYSPRRSALPSESTDRLSTLASTGHSSSALSPAPRRRPAEEDGSDETAKHPRVYLWGLASHKLLPEETAAPVSNERIVRLPVEVSLPAAHTPVAVACSPYTAAVLTLEGKVLTWGRARHNATPLLGDSSLQDRSLPNVLDIPVRVRALAMGVYHVLALTENGSAYVWGSNSNGQLGLGLPDLIPHAETPTLLASLQSKPLAQLAAGAAHSLALTRDGKVFVFGLGQNGQLGHGSTASCSTPNELKTLKGPASWISAAMNHSACVVSGEVHIWGHNLGFSGRTLLQPQVVPVNRGEVSICQVSCGPSHIALLSDLGTVYTWGEGLIGHDTERELEPRVVSALQEYSAAFVSCGGRHTAVITDERRLFTFGRDAFGQLGLDRGDQSRPVQVERLEGLVMHACASENATAAVTSIAHSRLNLLFTFFGAEQSYLRTIAMLQKIFAPGLARILEREEDLRLLFASLELVRRFTVEFIHSLHYRISIGWFEQQRISDLFLGVLPTMANASPSPVRASAAFSAASFGSTAAAAPAPNLEAVYSEYCRVYRKCAPILERIRATPSTEPLLADLRRQVTKTTLIKPRCRADEAKLGDGTPDIFALIEPTRRVHHYLGFLQRILELTRKDHPDYAGLVSVTDTLSELNRKISIEQSDSDFALLMGLKVYRKLEVFLGGGHRFITHTSVRIRLAENQQPELRLLLLFDNKLAIATPEKVEMSFPLEHLWLVPCENDQGNNLPALALLVPEKPRMVGVIEGAPSLRDAFMSKFDATLRALLEPHPDCAYVSALRRRVGKWPHKFRDGQKYSGDWELAKPHGKGSMLYASGDKFEGEFMGGLREGSGVLTRRSGERYEGGWRADKRHGTGVLQFAKPLNPNVLSADRYSGEFHDDRPHGIGEFVYDGGAATLKGEFERGAPTGTVIVNYQAGDIYVGEWQSHRAQGYGAMLYKNDDVYFGTWQGGKAVGFGYYACPDGTEYYGEWNAGRMVGKGTIWFANKTWLAGKFNGHLVDNTLSLEGQLQREAEPSRTLTRKRTARWENWFQLKSKLVKPAAAAAAASQPPPLTASQSLSALEPFGFGTPPPPESALPSHSPTSSVSSSLGMRSSSSSGSEQMIALASLGAGDAAAAAMQLLRTSEVLSSALADWTKMINGLYGSGSERIVRLHGRVLEDVQSFVIALGMQILRLQPELNSEAGLDATWLALELSALPLVYDSVFTVIRKKFEMEDMNVSRSVARLLALPLPDQLNALGLDRALIGWLSQLEERATDGAAAVFASASALLGGMPKSRSPSEKLECLRGAAKEIEAAVRSQRSDLGADDFLPLFTWIVARFVRSAGAPATAVALTAEVQFIDSFMNETARTSLLGYLFINLMSAANMLRDLGPKLPVQK